ncbi:MAG: autotransporter outer membrane beta-barrel domain-containing protein [Cellvibrionaceae bacterium]|nr:autotransporter outer membrane beta-barrel domain-containing protein [Cellvibrionaceae bacterium]
MASVIGGFAFSSTSWAQHERPQVNEPRSGTKTYAMPFEIAPALLEGVDIQELVACTISGTVKTPVSQSQDYVLIRNDYSVRIQPRRAENGEIILDSAYGEALFEILADDELEGPEEVGLISNPSYNSYEVTCDGGVAPYITLFGVYGGFIIDDPSSQQVKAAAIPVHQKSLSAQLNSLRTLSLHNSITRDRSIAKEIDRARKSSAGFRADNLQVRLQEEALPINGLLGGAAGDAENFGRWGTFITGNVDLGKQEKNSAIESDFHTNMLIAGVDYKASDNIVLGAAVTHSDTKAGDDKTANTDFRRYSLSLFGSIYSRDRFYLDGMVTYGTSAYDLDRRIAVDVGGADVSTADTDGDELSASLGAGYNVHHNNLNARFFTFINYIDTNIDGYTETVTGDSSAAVVDGMDLQSFIANVGVELSWNINSQMGVFTPTLSIAQERQYADDSVYVTGHFVGGLDEGRFTYTAPERDDNYMNAQLGLNAVLKNGVSAFVSYDTFIDRKDFASWQLSVGARWEL